MVTLRPLVEISQTKEEPGSHLTKKEFFWCFLFLKPPVCSVCVSDTDVEVALMKLQDSCSLYMESL